MQLKAGYEYLDVQQKNKTQLTLGMFDIVGTDIFLDSFRATIIEIA